MAGYDRFTATTFFFLHKYVYKAVCCNDITLVSLTHIFFFISCNLMMSYDSMDIYKIFDVNVFNVDEF